MIFHHVLDQVFSTWSHIAVLRALQDYAQGITGREIARASQMNHRSCLKALGRLEDLGVVVRLRGGRDHLFSLNRNHVLVTEGIIPLVKLERGFFESLTKLLTKELGPLAESLILFGSVAKKTETAQSDLDLCIVLANGTRKLTARKRLESLAPLIRRKYGANLAPFFLSRSEFLQRAKKRHPPVSSIVKEGIVIAGKPLEELTRG
ncbi:MAG: winged helix-turn-helix transcriptional regulator [Ignavibacteria bacterium]|nr:winged helix-turn-helix transcriptional regulator [Ignavibacteria bacterium]